MLSPRDVQNGASEETFLFRKTKDVYTSDSSGQSTQTGQNQTAEKQVKKQQTKEQEKFELQKLDLKQFILEQKTSRKLFELQQPDEYSRRRILTQSDSNSKSFINSCSRSRQNNSSGN